MNEYDRARDEALARAAQRLAGVRTGPGPHPGTGTGPHPGTGTGAVLGQLWDLAFEQGRLAALDEFQDRFCVCMK
jgi:hypothetical protein